MSDKLEQIFKNIIEAVKEEKQPFAVFDFDNTIIINDIGEASLAYLSTNNLFKDKNLSGAKVFNSYYKLLDEDRVEDAYKMPAEVLSGFSVKEVEDLIPEIIKSEGEEIRKEKLFGREVCRGMKLRPKVIELVNFLKNNEVEVWVVSASPEIFVSAALKYYKINAKVIGLRNIIVDDKITLELKKPLSIITGKVDCIKEFINSRHTPLLGVGDSINDLPMLEYCKIKIVVDRQNALAEKAKQNNWFLI